MYIYIYIYIYIYTYIAIYCTYIATCKYISVLALKIYACVHTQTVLKCIHIAR